VAGNSEEERLSSPRDVNQRGFCIHNAQHLLFNGFPDKQNSSASKRSDVMNVFHKNIIHQKLPNIVWVVFYFGADT